MARLGPCAKGRPVLKAVIRVDTAAAIQAAIVSDTSISSAVRPLLKT